MRCVTKTELFQPPCNCKSQSNSAVQYLYNTTDTVNPNATMPLQRNAPPAPPFLHDMPLLCKSQWYYGGANGHVTHPGKVTYQSSPQRQCHRDRIRTLADGCGHENNVGRTNTALPSDSQTKREPFAMHSGKITEIWEESEGRSRFLEDKWIPFFLSVIFGALSLDIRVWFLAFSMGGRKVRKLPRKLFLCGRARKHQHNLSKPSVYSMHVFTICFDSFRSGLYTMLFAEAVRKPRGRHAEALNPFVSNVLYIDIFFCTVM